MTAEARALWKRYEKQQKTEGVAHEQRARAIWQEAQATNKWEPVMYPEGLFLMADVPMKDRHEDHNAIAAAVTRIFGVRCAYIQPQESTPGWLRIRVPRPHDLSAEDE